MTASANNVLVNSNFTYTVAVTNYGPSSASNVLVADTLPSGITIVSTNSTLGLVNLNGTLLTWNVTNSSGILPVNVGAQLTITLRSSSLGTIVNSARVQSTTPDANSDDDFASVAVNVVSSLPPPQVSAISVGGGAFHLTISNPDNSTVIIQASTNLVNWVNVYTSTLPSITFTDSTQTNYHDQFYRAKIGP